MAKKFCPGAANISGTPTLKVKKCPECGGEVEIFSSDTQIKCKNCGFTIFNDLQSCIKWCKSARECIGDELYDQLINKKSST
jgi:hypothetical protein